MTGPLPPTPASLENIVIPDAKQDVNYQQTIAALARAMQDYQAQQLLERQQYDTSYNDAARRIGWTGKGWNNNTGNAYGDAMYTNTNDFAGRGMTHSGANVQATNNIANDFADRKSQLDLAKTNDVNTQAQALQSFRGQQEQTSQSALNDALTRLASRYSVTPQEVPVGSSKTISRIKV